jgi:transposase-like protein
MPKAYPKEFRDDAVAIVRRRELSFARVAKDVGISETCVQKRSKQAEIEGGIKPHVTATEHAENRELEKRVRLLEQERGAASSGPQSGPGRAPKVIYPLVRELAEVGAPIRVPASVTRRLLKTAKRSHSRLLKNPVSDRERDEAQLTNAAVDSADEGPTFGNRLVADDLADLGFTASDRLVWRLYSVNALVSEIGHRKRGKRTKPGSPELGDGVQRQFTAATPDPLWLTGSPRTKPSQRSRWRSVDVGRPERSCIRIEAASFVHARSCSSCIATAWSA